MKIDYRLSLIKMVLYLKFK